MQPGHARGVGADAGHDETVAVVGGLAVGGDGDLRTDALEGALRRTQVARAVVEDGDALDYRTPFVDGTP
ncbi:hypothetical protein GCM10027265_09280 [Jatrophihabitans fulvus]